MGKKKSEFVIVRAKDAGVHCGYLVTSDANRVTLTECRRVWRWRGANSLSEMANHGIDEIYSRISEPVSKNVIAGYCEILSCTEKAQANLSKSRWSA